MFSMHILNVTPKMVSVDFEYNSHNYVLLHFVLFVYFYLCYVEFSNCLFCFMEFELPKRQILICLIY